MAKVLSFVAAMKDYFGLRESKSNQDFIQEIRALTIEDKQFFERELTKVGYEIVHSQA